MSLQSRFFITIDNNCQTQKDAGSKVDKNSSHVSGLAGSQEETMTSLLQFGGLQFMYICIIVKCCMLVIQFRNSKIDFNMDARIIDCRNKHWSQYFNQILFLSTGYFTLCPAVVMQAALESRAACTTTAGHIVR